VAKARLEALGCSDEVSLFVCTERYPMKDYESFCFPSGEYLSVKLMIGEAEGRNWWCVLFPRLCTDMAVSKEEQFIAVGFTPDQYKIITESENAPYKIRFRLLEFFEELGWE
jgi:stage II sporulation protein R